MNISVVISTYNRAFILKKILRSLVNILPKNNKLEINICDSFSIDGTHKIKNSFLRINKNFKIKYYNINKNILSSKRNFGISKSSYKNIILLDDDCVPKKNFLLNYISDFKKIDFNTILCGIVEYNSNYLKKSSYLRFRNSRHFKLVDNQDLEPKFVVAMNMGFKINKKNKNLLKFNEKFLGYGFEDYEFAFRMKKNKFNLKKTQATIIHDEGRPIFSRYLKKYFYLGRDGMRDLLIINNKAAKETIYYKFENNLFYKIIFNTKIVILPVILLEKIIVILDKHKLICSPIFYNFARFLVYTRGYMNREKTSLKKERFNWYE
jgi:glycosyltransferase involved in cell wall biosynthesis